MSGMLKADKSGMFHFGYKSARDESWIVDPILGKWSKSGMQKCSRKISPQKKSYYDRRQKRKITPYLRSGKFYFVINIFGSRVQTNGDASKRRVLQLLSRYNRRIDSMYKELRIPKDHNDGRIVEYVKNPNPETWQELLKDYKRQ